MTGSVREQLWRRPRREVSRLHTNWQLNLGRRDAVPSRGVEHDIDVIPDALTTRLMGRFPWFGRIDVFDTRSSTPNRAWFVGASTNVIDMNGKLMTRVQRVFPDTRLCELYHRTQQGDVHSVDYYEVLCGAVIWFPVIGTREQVLEWLPIRFHRYVAPEGRLTRGQKQQFVEMCLEKQRGGTK